MIEGDSTEYELLEKCCKLIKVEDPLTLEIGVRQGKGSQIILENLKNKKHWHIGVDPYGNLDYQHYDESGSYRCDYTNSMKLQLLKDLDYPNFTFSIAVGSSLRTAQANTIIGADKIINTNSSFQSDCLASNNLPW